MAASFPSSVKSFTSRVSGDTIQPAHINDLQDEVTALETGLFTSGTWTITLASSGGGTPTYTNRTGYYLRKGNEVTASGILTLLTRGTLAAGTMSITGLPFASKNATGNYAPVEIPYWATLTTSVIHLGGFVPPNVSAITLTKATAAATSSTTLDKADLADTSEFIFSVTYIIG